MQIPMSWFQALDTAEKAHVEFLGWYLEVKEDGS